MQVRLDQNFNAFAYRIFDWTTNNRQTGTNLLDPPNWMKLCKGAWTIISPYASTLRLKCQCVCIYDILLDNEQPTDWN